MEPALNHPADLPVLGPLIVDIQGTTLDCEDLDLLTHPYIGGVILFARNYRNHAQLMQLVNHIKSLRYPQLLVCVDQEGGRVQRFKHEFTHLPALHSLGRLYEQDRQQALVASRSLARLMAHELKATGIDFSFAPVVDIYNPTSKIIADRAFHQDPHVIAQLATAYMEGLHDVGMIAVAKHFPGHGGVIEDSHLCLPADLRCFRELEETDILPYKKLIRHNLDALMSAHVLFEHIDTLPSGFSRFWIHEIVREKLGFQGIVFTDDLSMQGATVMGGIIDRTHLALEAGCDIALICNDRDAVMRVLDDSSLRVFLNNDKDLSHYCRRQPHLADWEPQRQETDSLLSRLEAV